MKNLNENAVHQHMTIHQWAEEDRPREKLIARGADHLSDIELLSILIGTGTRKKTAFDLARELLMVAENKIVNLVHENLSGMCKVQGIGLAKAVNILAALELSRRCTIPNPADVVIQSSTDAYRYMRKHFDGLQQEEFWILLLNPKLKPIFVRKIASGTLTMVPIDLRLIGNYICKHMAHAIVVFHNHPSGCCQPSLQDEQVTHNIKEICKLFHCTFIDHVIIGSDDFYSMSRSTSAASIAASPITSY
ncbi:MAG: DNA repair protein RadC [Saprospiraceae bacterium]|nr:DNA repair protein RadC [Saprospiraceae bacterium]